MKGDRLGALEMAIMLALASERGGATGRQIYNRLVDVTGRDVSVAAVHITLRRLQSKKLVSCDKKQDVPGGPAFNVFDLTPGGAKAVREARDELDRLWQGARLHPRLKGRLS
jgi:PadR family transcriptional regulator PadR